MTAVTLLPTSEVPVPKFSLTDLTDRLTAQASGKPQEAQQTTGSTPTPPRSLEAPSRPAPGRERLRLSARETTAALTSGRQQMREARAYAEEWYQALRAWEWKNRGETVPRDLSPRSPAKRQMTPVVGNWGAGDVMLVNVQVQTPLGWVAESALALAITREGGVLERLRNGGGLASLVDERGGWHPHRERAVGYALAVLSVASALGDGRAESALQIIEKG